MPSPALLGQLKKPANFRTLKRWVKNHLFENDPVVVALDTLAYGGLIPSRVNTEPLETLQKRVAEFFGQVKADACYGFSSILRIPHYNNAEEEPDYWADYGVALYEASVAMHRTGSFSGQGRIPDAVLEDFLSRRQKNHALNEHYLGYLQDGRLDYLTYCQDDTGPYGLNVQEAEALGTLIKRRKLGGQTHIQTGADEVAACMLARWMASQHTEPPKVYPFYSSEAGRKLIARFDGLPIDAVTEKAIRACGAVVAAKAGEADLWLMVHTPEARQGDHCAGIEARTSTDQAEEVVRLVSKALQQGKAMALADVAYANGSDPKLSNRLLTQFEDLTGLYGYAGWNTPGNTLGTAAAMGLIRWMAEQNRTFNPEAFCRLMLVRLADDWLYQADVRQVIRGMMNGRAHREAPDETLLNIQMADGLNLLKTRLGLEGRNIHCRFPCNRTFEVEIGING